VTNHIFERFFLSLKFTEVLILGWLRKSFCDKVLDTHQPSFLHISVGDSFLLLVLPFLAATRLSDSNEFKLVDSRKIPAKLALLTMEISFFPSASAINNK